MYTKRFLVEYTQTQKGAFNDPITRFNAHKFDNEKVAKNFLLDVMRDDMWDLDSYKFITIEEWTQEKANNDTKIAIDILKKILTR